MTTSSIAASTSTASALSALTASSATSSSSSSRAQRVPGHVQTAADALGMSSSDVMAALKSGKSLLDVADDQGVSRDDLLAALKAGAPEELRSSDDADAAIEALASQTGVGGPGGVGGAAGRGDHGHHGGGHGGPPPASATTGVLSGNLTSTQTSTLSALSDLLGTDSSSLLTQLQSGGDLAGMLSSKGVSLDQLSAKLEEGLLVDTRA